MKFKDKSVIITGASSGFGKDFALRIAKEGANIYLAARSEEKLEAIKSEVEELGGNATVVKCDVTIDEDVKNLFLTAAQDGPIDFVYNNAGLGHIAKIFELTSAQIKQMIDVNVYGMILVSKYAAEVMVRQKHGHILMSSSLAGLITLPEWSVYVASKWAITGFADSIRPELKEFNVQVTTLHPGAVRTEFFDESKANIDIAEVGEAIEVSEVTDVVYDAAFTNRKKVVLPGSSKMFAGMYKYIPALAQKLIERMADNADNKSEVEEDLPEFSFVKPFDSGDKE